MSRQLEVGKYYKFSHPREWFIVEVTDKKDDIYVLTVTDSDQLTIGTRIQSTNTSPMFYHHKVEEYKYEISDEVDYTKYPELLHFHKTLAVDLNNKEWFEELCKLEEEIKNV